MLAQAIIEKISCGAMDAEFTALYGAAAAEKQRARYVDAVRAFERLYGGGRDLAVYSAPGRTEIGGNHTDHQHGRVLAAAVSLDIIAVAAKNEDSVIRVQSEGFSGEDAVSLEQLEPQAAEQGRSAALVRGVAAGIAQRGGRLGGFDAFTTSQVLKGSGLSSSAAFEVCLGAVLNGEYNGGRFTPVQLGQVGQYAENAYFGKPSGLMDQTASAVGGVISIDFMNPASPVVEKITLDLERFGHSLVITDTKGSHADLTGEYAAIREEMERVAARFGKAVLRDVPQAQFLDKIAEIREEVGDRALVRALHFYGDTERAGTLAEALRAGDFGAFLKGVTEGGHSSFEYAQNAYCISDPGHQGVSLGLALSQQALRGRGAWRLQGGGFAGTIQAFVPHDLLHSYCARLNSVFGQDACHVLTVREAGCKCII